MPCVSVQAAFGALSEPEAARGLRLLSGLPFFIAEFLAFMAATGKRHLRAI